MPGTSLGWALPVSGSSKKSCFLRIEAVPSREKTRTLHGAGCIRIRSEGGKLCSTATCTLSDLLDSVMYCLSLRGDDF